MTAAAAHPWRLPSFVRRQVTLFIVAVRFLTRLPVPPSPNFQPMWLARSARYFPLVGVLVGFINVGIWRLSNLWLPNSVSVGLMLAASLLATGALHEDGFADACDGFGGGTTADRTLAIMKDSRIGAYGAIGIAVLLGLKWTTLAALPAGEFPLLVVAAHMVSRWCACGLIWVLSYVRAGDDAKAKPFAEGLSAGEWLAGGALGALAILICFGAGGIPPRAAELRALCAAMAAAIVTAAMAAVYFKQRIGGYTGDCLGAVQQLAELTFLLAALGTLAP